MSILDALRSLPATAIAKAARELDDETLAALVREQPDFRLAQIVAASVTPAWGDVDLRKALPKEVVREPAPSPLPPIERFLVERDAKTAAPDQAEVVAVAAAEPAAPPTTPKPSRKTGITAEVERALTDTPASAESIAKQIGSTAKRVSMLLSYLTTTDRAERTDRGLYRRGRKAARLPPPGPDKSLPVLVAGPGDRRENCARYDGCLTRFVQANKRAGTRAAHCPVECPSFHAVPGRSRIEDAHTFGQRPSLVVP